MANVQMYNDDIKSKLMNYLADYGKDHKQHFDTVFLRNWELENNVVILGVDYNNGKVSVPLYRNDKGVVTTQKLVLKPSEGKTTLKLSQSICDLVLDRFSDNPKLKDSDIETAKKTVSDYVSIRRTASRSKNLLQN